MRNVLTYRSIIQFLGSFLVGSSGLLGISMDRYVGQKKFISALERQDFQPSTPVSMHEIANVHRVNRKK
jgi:hypothetical protein